MNKQIKVNAKVNVNEEAIAQYMWERLRPDTTEEELEEMRTYCKNKFMNVETTMVKEVWSAKDILRNEG
jgi:hypothetical protein